MGFSNNLSRLLDKIENRLGLKAIQLPEVINKDSWANIIETDTIVTFSRYFPNSFNYQVDPRTHPKKNGYFLLDEDVVGNDSKIIGVKDINFNMSSFNNDSLTYCVNEGYGIYDYLAQAYNIQNIGMAQMRADHTSLFNNGFYVDFIPPNKFKIESSTGGDLSRTLGKFYIQIFLEHRPDLTTISPTQMEIFERLAQADIAIYLLRYLSHFEVETVYMQVDLKLNILEEEASKREEIINEIKEGYVSAANKNQPYLFCI